MCTEKKKKKDLKAGVCHISKSLLHFTFYFHLSHTISFLSQYSLTSPMFATMLSRARYARGSLPLAHH
jgi:multisubunit Na+/H+ antiporter MnhG subunit